MIKQEVNWNPYIDRVPVSKKLRQDLRGFDMAKNKAGRTPTLKYGTTGYDIIKILMDYKYYPEDKLHELIPDKQPDTIRKTVKALENAGYILRKKGQGGHTVITLSRLGKDILNVQCEDTATTPKKVTRMAALSVVNMMFHKSIPLKFWEGKENEIYVSKQEIIVENPGCKQALTSSRFTGVYKHFGRIMPVYKLSSSMYWQENAERQTKEYLENRIFGLPITSAIFLIENYQTEAMRFIKPSEGERETTGKALRESLELSSCYDKVFMFTTDRTGIEQLRLFRSLANIEDLFLDAVFEEEDKSTSDSIIDGVIDGNFCVVLFANDIIRIKKLYRMLEHGLIDQCNIICFDFQEEFLRKVYEKWQDRLIYNSCSLKELWEVYETEDYEDK